MANSIVCFGEVLWDVFPTHKKIGGAPLNVALRLKSFDHDVSMISSVGDDDLGQDILDFALMRGLNDKYIQKSDQFQTGEVQVTLDEKGSASYEIVYPKGWDDIQTTETNKQLVKDSDAFIFGSLVARGETSRDTLFHLLKEASYKIFDINLRPPHYDLSVLDRLMQEADFIKFNDDELFEISEGMGSEFTSIENNMKFISEQTKTDRICVTKGGDGAVLLYDGKFYHNKGYPIKVADTVGAGDSFLATLTHQLLSGQDPQKAIDYACAVGAMVAGSEGANPEISANDIEMFIDSH
ncbi:MAG: carbohydrate kinase [Flavobacteriaceae bacterium]|nr:carbohydrate kinase [Bacteroidia bacterium]MBT8269133.1 carbohydrate kinase [Bacteroidia bacterium]NNF73665.1 carbohydrate kinase [Flavobacteriaceae bacterium]